FKHLENETEELKQQLPENQTIYVVCAKGISSQRGVEILEEARVMNITYLVGGMEAWSEHLEPMRIGELSNSGVLYQFLRIGNGCVSDMSSSNGSAVIIDQVRMTETYTKFAQENNAAIRTVLDSYLQAEHISGGKTLADESNAVYYLPPKDDEGLNFNSHTLE